MAVDTAEIGSTPPHGCSAPPSAALKTICWLAEIWCGQRPFWLVFEQSVKPVQSRWVFARLLDILKTNYRPTGPLLACLFTAENIMLDRQKTRSALFTVVGFWLPRLIDDCRYSRWLKTDRKWAACCLPTHNQPKDAIDSPIFDTVRKAIHRQNSARLPNTKAITRASA